MRRRPRDAPLTTFTADACADLDGPTWLRSRRSDAWERFTATAPPSESEEIWRYSGIDAFDLGAFGPVGAPSSAAAAAAGRIARDAAAPFGDRCGLVVTWHGRVVEAETEGAGRLGVRVGVVGPDAAPGGATVDGAGSEDLAERFGRLGKARDAFGQLHEAFVADVVSVRVPPKAVMDSPLVVVHVVDPGAGAHPSGPAAFPHTVVEVGTSAEASVVELLVSPPGPDGAAARRGVAGVPGSPDAEPGADRGALVVPVAELDVADDARLAYLNLQLLGSDCWQVGLQASRVGRDATLRSFTAGFGGRYARVRTDSDLVGTGGRTALLAAYLGTGKQVLDFRTLQDHHAPRTESELLFEGAVSDTSRSVYSGLIRMRHGARGANAFQTNRNLVLSEGAHADSVPNLDILENDVRCSHASTVGPIDEEQRYYLESRGIEPTVAERLIVLGFFTDLAARAPLAPLAGWMRRTVAARLGDRIGSGSAGGRDG